MDFKQLSVTQVLDIDHVEVYQTHSHSGDLITQGTLSILYSSQHNWYILRVNNFNYGISKRIPVLASSQERGSIRAYVFPNPQGYLVIKVTRAQSMDHIEELENILKSTTELAWKEGQGLPVRLDGQTVTVKRGAAPEDEVEDQRQTTAAHIIYKGGKATRRMIVDAAQGISNGITRLGSHYQNQNETKTDGVLTDPKKASRLALFNSATGMAASTSTSYMKGITSIGNWIGQAIETKREERHAEKEIKKIKERTDAILAQNNETIQIHSGGVIGIGYATIYSAITIWRGMLEALDIIREGLSETAGGIVTQRYGQVAGEVFRAGVSHVSLPGESLFKRRI